MKVKWNKANRALLSKVIREHPERMRSGAVCIYIPVTRTICAKLYMNKTLRDQTYRLQAHAAYFGLGPQVGDRFTYPVLLMNRWDNINVKNRAYGYLSQRAKITGRCTEGDEEYMRLKLAQIGIPHDDLHTYNIGYVEGRMVCIDFDADNL